MEPSPQERAWSTIRDLHADGFVPVPLDALEWLSDRGWFELDELVCPPAHITPAPDYVEGAWFDRDEVQRTLRQFCALRHTKGRQFAGRPLRPKPWQIVFWIAPVFGWKHSLDPAVSGEQEPGSRIIRESMLMVPRKAGKALAIDTPLLTGSGWSTIGAVRPGDSVHTIDGTLTRVVAKSGVHFDPSGTFEVEFADGQVLVAGGAHEWVVRDCAIDNRVGRARRLVPDRQWVTLTTVEIARSIDGDDRRFPTYRYSVRADRVVERPEVDLPIDPYLLGAWLGDGETASGRITSGDPQLFDEIEAAGYETSHDHTPRINSCARTVYGIRPVLRSLGVLGNKHVPSAYLEASSTQRLALLQGLIDTDGTVSTRGQVEFTTITKPLADGVLQLARSLGMKASVAEGSATLHGRVVSPKWRVLFYADRSLPPCRLERKVARLKSERGARSRTNKIVRVERVDDRPLVCIEVAHPSRQYLAGEGLIPTHNSTMSSATALKLLSGDGEPGGEVYAAAKDRNQAKLVFEPAKQMAQRSPELAARLECLSTLIRHPKSLSVFRALSSLADAAQGLNVSGAVIDELHVHKDRELVDVIATGTGARAQPLVQIITTADDGQQGTIFDEKYLGIIDIAKGKTTDEPSMHGAIFAASDEADPFDETTWWAANPSMPDTPSVGYMRAEAAKAQNRPAYFPTFSRLHLNQRRAAGAGMFNMLTWRDNGVQIVNEDLLEHTDCFSGIVVSSTTDWAGYVLVFPRELLGFDGEIHNGYEVVGRFFLPVGAIGSDGRRHRESTQIQSWERAGWCTLTPGDAIDYEAVRSSIGHDLARFNVREGAYLRWQAENFRQQLVELRPPKWKDDDEWVWPLSSSMDRMAAPTEEVYRCLEVGVFHTGGNPVLDWFASNAVAKTDAEKRVKPDSAQSRDSIAGVQAAVLAVAAAIREKPKAATPSMNVV